MRKLDPIVATSCLAPRRRLIAAGAFAVVSALPDLSRSQQTDRLWKLAWLSPADGPGPNHDAFLARLKSLGYEQGKNFQIEWAWIGSHPDSTDTLARKLVMGNPDVLISQSQVCALALQRATKTIPIVFVGVRDPVRIGLVESMARPGKNLTGLTLTPSAELVQKHLELLTEIVPKANGLAVFWNPDVPVQAGVVKTIAEAAERRGIATRPLEVHRPGDIERGFDQISHQKIDGLLTLVEWFTFGQRPLLAKLAIEHRIPTFFEVKDYAVAGGLISYGIVYHEHFASAAGYVDKILKGAKPAEIPVQDAARLEMVVNVKTAASLGITIPTAILIRADQLIEA
jgi:putative ABC transport system substrate-binding protein